MFNEYILLIRYVDRYAVIDYCNRFILVTLLYCTSTMSCTGLFSGINILNVERRKRN